MAETPINGISSISPGYRNEIHLDGAGPFDISSTFEAGAVYTIDPQGNAVSLTIPDPSASTEGRWAKFSMEDSVGGGSVTVETETGQPIGGSTSQVIGTNYKGFELQDEEDHWGIMQDSRNGGSSPSSLVLYGLDEASGVASYLAATSSQTDVRYNAVEQDLTPTVITGAAISIGEWATPDGILVGVVPATNWIGTARATQTLGSAEAEVYFELYHRTSGGAETLIGTSNTSVVLAGTVDAYDLTLYGIETTFLITDRLVAKLYANKVGVASNPTVVASVEGFNNPTRLSVAVPSTTIAHNVLQGIQGGAANEAYHLTSVEYTGVWGHGATFDGDVGVMTTSPRGPLDIANTIVSTEAYISTYSTNTANQSVFKLLKSASATIGTLAATVADEDLGIFAFVGVKSDNSESTAAYILGEQEGATDATNIGGRMLFYTATKGANSVERMRLNSLGNLGIGAAPVASAILDLTSTTKGFLLPKMTETQRDNISSPDRLMIYNTDDEAINFHNGTAWKEISFT